MKIVNRTYILLGMLIATFLINMGLLSQTGILESGSDTSINEKLQEKISIVQGLLLADFVVFIVVIISIKRSLKPLGMITGALSRLKEGFYGEKINYYSNDELGRLAQTFDLMSETIKQKDEETKKIEISKDEFLTMITHELKTPLIPIQGYADILLGEHLGSLNKSQKERLEIIKSSCSTLLQLISDLLEAQKLELGQLKIEMKDNNLKETIENTISSMMPKAIADEIELVSDVTADVYAYYDDERISQVLTNLIKNAIKAVTPKKGKVHISVMEQENSVLVSVKDNGTGLPKESLDKIFKKFYQVDTSSTREKGGSGLGLSICMGIVETHGGKIWAESELGMGATFNFTLQKIKNQKSNYNTNK